MSKLIPHGRAQDLDSPRVGAEGLVLELHGEILVGVDRCPGDLLDRILRLMWPFALARSPDSDRLDFRINIVNRGIDAARLSSLPQESISLFNAFDQRVPDYDAGVLISDAESGERVVVNPGTGGAVAFAGRCATLFQPDPVMAVKDLWRLLKQIAISQFTSQGYGFFHASAVDTGDGAIVFMGHKGAGKTTMSQVRVAAGCRFISNDKLFAKQLAPGSGVVAGWGDPIRFVLPAETTDLKREVSLREHYSGDTDRIGRI